MDIRNLINPQAWRRKMLGFKYGFTIPEYDGMMNEAKCAFLHQTVLSFTGAKNLIVEIGSWKGCSTTWLATAGKKKGFKGLIAIDLFTGTPSWGLQTDTYDAFLSRMKVNGLVDFVQALRGDSRDISKTWDPAQIISILHIDGDHSYEATKADILNFTPFVQKGGVVIVDDYDSLHPEVIRAADELLRAGSYARIGRVEEIPEEGFGAIAFRKNEK